MSYKWTHVHKPAPFVSESSQRTAKQSAIVRELAVIARKQISHAGQQASFAFKRTVSVCKHVAEAFDQTAPYSKQMEVASIELTVLQRIDYQQLTSDVYFRKPSYSWYFGLLQILK